MKGNVLKDDDNMIDVGITPHAACYVNPTASTTITTAGTYYTLLGTHNPITSTLFTHVDTGWRYDGTKSKYFKVDAKLSASCSDNNVTITFKIAVNGIPDDSSIQTFTKTAAGDTKAANPSTFILLNQNDLVTVMVTSSKSGGTVTAINLVVEISSI